MIDSFFTLIKTVIIIVWAYLAPVHGVIISATVLIFIDLLTGLAAAYKKRKKITSSALSRTIAKLTVYQSAIISGYICEKYLMHDVIPVAKLVSTFIGIVELKSILENLDTIHGTSVTKGLVKRLSNEFRKQKDGDY